MRKANAGILFLFLLTSGCMGGDDEGTVETINGEIPVTGPLGSFDFSASGTILVSSENVVEAECGFVGGEGVGRAAHSWEIPTDVNGTAARIANLTVTLTMGPTGVDLDLHVFGPNDQLVGSSTDFNPMTDNTETVRAENLAAGTYRIEVHGCTGAAASYSLAGTADLVAS